MSGDTSNALVNLGNLSKPADTLIKKVSGAIGCLYEPYQTKRVARADVAADLIRAKGEIETKDVHRRAMCRFVDEEAKKQENMESITAQALPMLDEDSDPSAIDDDWITNFFDKCRIVSDSDMQTLWSAILSSEANRPGAISKRTVNFLAGLDKEDAAMFMKICGFVIVIEKESYPFIADRSDAIYSENGIDFDLLNHLDCIGLITLSDLAKYFKSHLSSPVRLQYHSDFLECLLPVYDPDRFVVGEVLFSQMGRELASVCNCELVVGFKDYLLDVLKKRDIEVAKNWESA